MTASERADEMRDLPLDERNRRIAYGVLSGKVVDLRKRLVRERSEREDDCA